MFVSGAPLRSPGPHGEQQVDKSFAMFFNSGDRSVQVELPENDWVHSGEVASSTDPKLPIGTPVKTGDRMRCSGRAWWCCARSDPGSWLGHRRQESIARPSIPLDRQQPDRRRPAPPRGPESLHPHDIDTVTDQRTLMRWRALRL